MIVPLDLPIPVGLGTIVPRVTVPVLDVPENPARVRAVSLTLLPSVRIGAERVKVAGAGREMELDGAVRRVLIRLVVDGSLTEGRGVDPIRRGDVLMEVRFTVEGFGRATGVTVRLTGDFVAAGFGARVDLGTVERV